MAIWTILVVLAAPWALGLVSSAGGYITFALVSLMLVMAAYLSALLIVTIQGLRGTRSHATLTHAAAR